MEFLAPIMLLGAAGAAIPVVIHLIGRRRARVVRFAAIDFLIGSNKKVARRLQLRELLLLLARVLICLAMAFALAKPFTSCTTSGPRIERGAQAAVLIVDNSLSGAYELDGQPVLGHAQRRAREVLRQMGPEAEVAVMGAVESTTAPEELTRDHIGLQDTIDALSMTPRPVDLPGALRRAAQLLETSPQQKQHIFLIVPRAAAALELAEPPWEPGTGPSLTVIDVSGGEPLGNAAIVSLTIKPDASAGSRGVRVSAEIANFSDHAIDGREVSLRIGSDTVARGTISLRPGERQTKEFSAALPSGARFADVLVSMSPDALALDDRRYLRAELREQVRTLLVNGDPRTVRHEDELFYLDAALRPGDRSDSGVALQTTTVGALGEAPLDEFDAVVLANARALPPEQSARLADWVQAGGGLLIATGDQVRADDYNKTMRALMPQELRDPVEVTYGAQGQERRARALRLSQLEHDHPVFTVFSQEATGIKDAQFHTVTFLGPTTRVDERKVLARYSNGGAALIEARSGEGRLMLFTSSLDRDWTDFPIHPGFVPFTQRTVRYLARKQGDRRERTTMVGRRHAVPVVADTIAVEITRPDGRRTVLEGDRVVGRKWVGYSDTYRPGIYRVQAAAGAGELLPLPEADFAVNLDPAASDLRVIERADPTATSAAEFAPTMTNSPHRRRVELWHALAALLLAVLLLESILLLR